MLLVIKTYFLHLNSSLGRGVVIKTFRFYVKFTLVWCEMIWYQIFIKILLFSCFQLLKTKIILKNLRIYFFIFLNFRISTSPNLLLPKAVETEERFEVRDIAGEKVLHILFFFEIINFFYTTRLPILTFNCFSSIFFVNFEILDFFKAIFFQF